jgi:hypothetical protein
MYIPLTAAIPQQGLSAAPALLDFDRTRSLFTPRIRAACRRYRGSPVHQDDLHLAAAIALWRSLRQLYELRHLRGLTQAETTCEMTVSQQRVSYLEQKLASLTRAAA